MGINLNRIIFYGIAFSFLQLIGCNSDREEGKINNPSDTSAAIIAKEGPTSKKIDTIINYLGPKQSFKYNIRFGMTIPEWNQALAILTKENIIKELNEEKSTGAYFGISKDNSFPDMNYRLSAILRNSVENKNQSIVIHSIDNTINASTFLCGVEYQYYSLKGEQNDVILDNLLNNNNLTFLHGNIPFRMSTLSDYEKAILSLKRIEREISSKEPSDIRKFQRDTIRADSESLFQNDLFYFVIKVSETKDVNYVVDGNDKLSSFKVNSVSNALNYKVYSKVFSDLDVSEYKTSGEEHEEESKNRSETLIEKALNN